MADSKAAKLAAGLKKLREHQEKKQSIWISKENDNNNSPLAPEPLPTPRQEEIPIQIIETAQNGISQSSPAGFFDNIPTSNNGYFGQVYESKNQVSDVAKNSSDPFNSLQINNQKAVDNENIQLIENLKQTNIQLEQQIQNHRKAAEMLVSEKSNLQSQFEGLQNTLYHLENQCQILKSQENVYRTKITHLESELNNMLQSNVEIKKELESKSSKVNDSTEKESKLIERLEELDEKFQLTSTALTAKQNENSSLRSELTNITAQLELTQLHLQQINDGHVSPESAETESAGVQRQMHEQIAKLEEQLKEANLEKEQVHVHYQQYAQQLNNQFEILSVKNKEIALENEALLNREQGLIEQMSDLEKQLQQLRSQEVKNAVQKQLVEAPVPGVPETDHNQLKDAHEQLKEAYAAQRAQMEEMQVRNESLFETIQQMKTENPDIVKLNAANESDKLAAQRATLQNTKLKEDLTELQDAFVQMSIEKLDWTEKVQAEKFLNRELTIKLAEIEENFKSTQLKLQAKDEEMIRLQASCSQLEKDILQQNQVIDRLRHFEATYATNDIVQAELQSANHVIAQLNQDNEKLRSGCINPTTIPENIKNEDQNNTKTCNKVSFTHYNNGRITALPTDEATEKLQQRFMETMKQVADLSEERSTLEHLVLQLQHETETICEYITLYQQQRGILKQREIERTEQLKLMTVERVHMKTQLDRLKNMIANLAQIDNSQSSMKEMENESLLNGDEIDIAKGPKVEKIMNLLTEIKQSHLIEPNKTCTGLENFHPCPWCSGKLINV